jgi:hypothetical protein
VRRAGRVRVGLLALALLAGAAAPGAAAQAPEQLAETGLYADFAARAIDPAHLPYSPQYPLWTDGAAKRRWIRIPAGTAIDASDPDAWVFPAGTRLWKEFSLGGRPVETRYMERLADGSWLYATDLWSADGSEARRAPERGVRRVAESAPGVPYDLPGVWDCRSCHEGSPSRVLGFGALQLSPDRDPLAPHQQAAEPGAVDLPALAERGLLRGLPPELLATPPRVAAASPAARAALGYLHGNCAGCHNGSGPLADLDFSLEVRVAPAHSMPAAALATASGHAARFQPAGAATQARIAPGAPERSLVALRMASRDAILQMPPLGTHRIDAEAVALVEDFIRELGRPVVEVTASRPHSMQ